MDIVYFLTFCLSAIIFCLSFIIAVYLQYRVGVISSELNVNELKSSELGFVQKYITIFRFSINKKYVKLSNKKLKRACFILHLFLRAYLISMLFLIVSAVLLVKEVT